MTFTPSVTAASIAATESEVRQPSATSPPTQQTLYAATRAPGAMPEIRLTPSWRPWIVGLTPKSPAAVEAVCVPWPSSSRGETKESGATWLRPKPCRKKRAPMSLLLGQSAANVGSLPVSHVPFQPLLGGGAVKPLPEKLGCCGV